MRQPKYIEIAEKIAARVRDGELVPGARLPTHRTLSETLGVSVQTVFRAYQELEKRKIISSEVGRGSFVRFIDRDDLSSFTINGNTNYIDFTLLVPVYGTIQRESFKKFMREISNEGDIDRVLSHRSVSGPGLVRSTFSEWTEKITGAKVAAENVVTTNGAHHAIFTAMTTLLEVGDTLLCPEFVDSSVISMAATLGVRLKPIPEDQYGLIPEDLELACKRECPKALYVCPIYSNPTCSEMSASRLDALCELANKYNLSILEDGVFAPLKPDQSLSFLQVCPDRVIYCSGFSKFALHALRSGFCILPCALRRRFQSKMRNTGWMANPISAEASMRWILDGTMERLRTHQIEILRNRQSALKSALPEASIHAGFSSLHGWIDLETSENVDAFLEAGARQNIVLGDPSALRVSRQSARRHLRICLGDGISPAAFGESLSLLVRTFDDLQKTM